MAVLNVTDLATLRQRVASNEAVDFTKPQVNVLFQAAEDWFEANKAGLISAMSAAGTAAGKTFTQAQLRRAATAWLAYKFAAGVS
jgi:hypothetical protein